MNKEQFVDRNVRDYFTSGINKSFKMNKNSRVLSKNHPNVRNRRFPIDIKTLIAISAIFLLIALPALAHHPLGGTTPQNFLQGFLSGLGHPIIGIDHFAFVIAIGLLAFLIKKGMWIPMSFILASMAGTGIHLMKFDLPAPELFIATSVLLFGIMVIIRNRPNLSLITVLAAIAGIFHGYAYGEAIVGAEITPLIAYLAGFTLIQGTIALVTYYLAKSLANNSAGKLMIRLAGFIIIGTGTAFFSSAIIG